MSPYALLIWLNKHESNLAQNVEPPEPYAAYTVVPPNPAPFEIIFIPTTSTARNCAIFIQTVDADIYAPADPVLVPSC